MNVKDNSVIPIQSEELTTIDKNHHLNKDKVCIDNDSKDL